MTDTSPTRRQPARRFTRPIVALATSAMTAALAVGAITGCAGNEEPMPTTSTQPSGPERDHDINAPFQMPHPISERLSIIYLGPRDAADAHFVVRGAVGGLTSLDLSIGETKTIDGYQFRLVSTSDAGAQLVVLDPDGKRVQ